MKALAAIGLFLTSTVMGIAGPEGVYDVRGIDDDGEPYDGLVTVVRMGETYQITWKFGEYHEYGTGIGAAPMANGTIMGPASEDDNVITVGYSDRDDDFGIAFYMENDNGIWEGIWTEYGSNEVYTENWYPK